MNLPIELVNKILDYRGEILHRENINKCKKELLFKSSMWICNHYGIECGYDMPDEIDKNEAINIYKNLLNCNCCESHNFYKPPLNLFEWGYCPPYDTYYEKPIFGDYNEYAPPIRKKNKCKCRCNEHCKMLCREYNDDYCLNYELQKKLRYSWWLSRDTTGTLCIRNDGEIGLKNSQDSLRDFIKWRQQKVT